MAPIYQFELSEEEAEGFKKLGYNPVELNKKENQIAELDTSDWIVVPKKQGNKFLKDSHAFNINPARLAYGPAVEKVGKELGINYKNTAKDSLNRGFIGNNNWYQSMMLPQFLGVKTTNMNEEVDYFHFLYLGSQNKIKVYDVSGKKIDSNLCEKLLMDSIKVQSPWRANYIDADYKVGKKCSEVHSDHTFNKQGKIINYKSEVLDKNTLMEDKQIDVIDFITKNHTPQRLVSKNVPSGNFNFYYPRSDNNSVAGFDASSVRADLYCIRDPSYRDSDLGVRSVKLAED